MSTRRNPDCTMRPAPGGQSRHKCRDTDCRTTRSGVHAGIREVTLAAAHDDNDYVERLIDVIRRKLLADAATFRKAKGMKKIRVSEKGTGFQVDFDLSI